MVSRRKKKERERSEGFREDDPYYVGVKILTSACWFELHRQERSKDPLHTEFVRCVYELLDITMERLQRYKFLDAFDFGPSARDGSWHDAPYIVSTNRERYTLIHSVGQRYARAENVPVIRWFSDYRCWQQQPADEFLPRAMLDPCFYEYYVSGALGYCKDQGISKQLGLVNSLPFRYHSLVPRAEDRAVYRRMLRESRPGDIITLPAAPLVVNIEIDKETQEEYFSEEQIQRLEARSILRNKIVLPVYPGGTREKEDVPLPGGAGYEPSRVAIRSIFPLDPGFAMTVNKAEGRTMKRVVLCLSYHGEAKTNWNRRGIYVAFSRVQRACDIRLLLRGRSTMDKWNSLSYIVDMIKDHTTPSFFAGYGRKSTDLSNRNWEKKRWNEILAYQDFKRRVESSK